MAFRFLHLLGASCGGFLRGLLVAFFAVFLPAPLRFRAAASFLASALASASDFLALAVVFLTALRAPAVDLVTAFLALLAALLTALLAFFAAFLTDFTAPSAVEAMVLPTLTAVSFTVSAALDNVAVTPFPLLMSPSCDGRWLVG